MHKFSEQLKVALGLFASKNRTIGSATVGCLQTQSSRDDRKREFTKFSYNSVVYFLNRKENLLLFETY